MANNQPEAHQLHRYFDDTTLPMFAADFDYFRLPPERWNLLLTRLIQVGLRAVNLPVPWTLHEAQPGAVDFSGIGSDRCNLTGLLETCAALELSCRLLPGPYLLERGILRSGRPARVKPNADTFEADVAGWFKAFSQALVSYQWPAGPVVALKLNLEPDALRKPVLSRQLLDIQWPIWLRKRYQGIAALNAAYEASHQTVNDVDFPQPLPADDSPLARDAQAFLQEVRQKSQDRFLGVLREAGWQIPVALSDSTDNGLPPEQVYSLLDPDQLPAFGQEQALISLQHAIQSDAEPPDIGSQPAWAVGAPIRPDGATRRSFAALRTSLWRRRWPDSQQDDSLLTVSFAGGGLIVARQDLELNVPLPKNSRPTVYRLYANGQMQVDSQLKTGRARLKGAYLTEDQAGQLDFMVYLDDPALPLPDIIDRYLGQLLTAQRLTLADSAAKLRQLGEALTPDQRETGREDQPVQVAARPPGSIQAARRGLHEAEAALRKAIASIGGLEAGFGTILGKSEVPAVHDAAPPAPVSPDVFEGTTREFLIEIGAACQKMAVSLQQTAETLPPDKTGAKALTIERYQHAYANAVAAAQAAREPLLDIIRRLRLEMASEQLPLVTWRVHHRLQVVAEALRWGVLRGNG